MVQIASVERSDAGPRPRPSGARPQSVAVVITSTAGLGVLEACLKRLAWCCETIDAELIVIRAGEAEELTGVIRRHPSAIFIVAPPGTRTRDLRRAGLLHCSRNIIAFVDDRRSDRRDWTALLCHGWHDWVANGVRIRTAEHAAVGASARPVLSVVIPAHDAGETLGLAMDAVMRSELPRASWELVVVDDASDDDTALVAAEHADRLVRLPGRAHGPGYARNRGFEVTLGEIVAFVNADVVVQPDTLRRAVGVLTDRPEVDAVFGTYDTQPAAKEFVSQYRNLLQHYYQDRKSVV